VYATGTPYGAVVSTNEFPAIGVALSGDSYASSESGRR
jgi:hypothetical protein